MPFNQLVQALLQDPPVPAWVFVVLLAVPVSVALVKIACLIMCVRRAIRGDDPKAGDRALKITEWLITRRGRPR